MDRQREVRWYPYAGFLKVDVLSAELEGKEGGGGMLIRSHSTRHSVALL